ncbi:MAG: SDR family oxidoreductase [Gammaproteobacteria bacterium]|nr:SDR family oxidoreductase [Gammaproteobacteria bacterium]
MKYLVLIATVAALCFSSHSVFADQAGQKTVLVTGASSGIGLRITELLSANGYLVYAGARKKQDLQRLEAMKNVQSVRLDVTVQEDIDAAVKFVTDQGRGLHGLVNNAGIAVIGPLIEVPVSELEWQMNVNVLGPYRVTQAFAPLIIASKGRITTISSISGILSGSMYGPYSMSKHAVESFADSLASEMQRFGVKVSVIEPGSYASKIGQSFVSRLEKTGYWTEGTAYQDELERMKSMMAGESKLKDPTDVAEAVMHALFSDTPKTRYMVVPNPRQAEITIRKAMSEMLQLNHDQAHSYSREQLIEMLDQELKEL